MANHISKPKLFLLALTELRCATIAADKVMRYENLLRYAVMRLSAEDASHGSGNVLDMKRANNEL